MPSVLSGVREPVDVGLPSTSTSPPYALRAAVLSRSTTSLRGGRLDGVAASSNSGQPEDDDDGGGDDVLASSWLFLLDRENDVVTNCVSRSIP